MKSPPSLHHRAPAILAATSLFGLSLSLCGQVLYSDSFTRLTGSGDGNSDPNGAADNFSDWGSNDNALGGTVSMAWEAGPTRAGGGRNQVTDGSLGVLHGGTAFFDLDVTTLAPNGFTVALDFNRFVIAPDPGPGAGGYLGIGLGVDSGSTLNDFTAIGAADVAFLFQQAKGTNAGNTEFYEDNVFTAGTNGTQGPFDFGNPDIEHSLRLSFTPQVVGAYGATDVIDVNVLVDGVASFDFTALGGDDFGTLAISANNFDPRSIDNLVVTAVPEPSAVATLLGLGVLSGLLLRRRR